MSGARRGPLPGRLPAAGQSTGRGLPWMSLGTPGEKPTTFWPSARRLLARLKPHRLALLLVVASSLVSVALSVTGPMLIGRATDIIFSGVVGEHLTPGESKQQVVAVEREAGHSHLADMISRMSLVPGAGIDFKALGATLLVATHDPWTLDALCTWRSATGNGAPTATAARDNFARPETP